MFKFKTILVLIILIGGLVAVGLVAKQERGPDPAIKATMDKYKGPDGILRDPTNDLGVKVADDVMFKKKDNKIELYYGKLMYEIDIEKDLKRVQDSMRVLGIEMGFTTNGNFVVKYKGEVVKEIAN